MRRKLIVSLKWTMCIEKETYCIIEAENMREEEEEEEDVKEANEETNPGSVYAKSYETSQ